MVDLVKKAGLAETLSGPGKLFIIQAKRIKKKTIYLNEYFIGPFTVFAPTNEAFADVDPAVLKALLGNVELLTKVLTYHVVGSEIPPSAIKNELLITTLAGEKIRVNVYGKKGEVSAHNVRNAKF